MEEVQAFTAPKRGRPKKSIEPMEMAAHQPAPVDFPASGPLDLDHGLIEPVTEPVVSDYVKTLAFMEEPVTIMIHETTNPNDQQMCFLAVNGQGAGPGGVAWLKRGVQYTMARKFVEKLACTRPQNVATVETRDMDGNMTTRIQRHAALLFPFSVISDANPKGRDWLREALARPV